MSISYGKSLKLTSDAKCVLSDMSVFIDKSFQAKNQSMAATGIADEYLKKGLRISPNILQRSDDDTYKQYLQRAVM